MFPDPVSSLQIVRMRQREDQERAARMRLVLAARDGRGDRGSAWRRRRSRLRLPERPRMPISPPALVRDTR